MEGNSEKKKITSKNLISFLERARANPFLFFLTIQKLENNFLFFLRIQKEILQ